MADRPSTRSFVPDDIGGRDVLFDDAPLIGTVEFVDGVIMFGPAILFLMMGDLVLPRILEPYIMFFSIFLAIIGGSMLIVKPSYLTVTEWMGHWRKFQSREKELQKELTKSNGQPFDSVEATPDDDTRRLTQVESVYPARDVIELTDGTMIQILEFTGSNLDMASQEIVLNTVDAYARSVSSQLQHDIQFYLPMRPISLKSTRDVYKEEKHNLNTAENIDEHFLETYMDDRIQWLQGLGEGSFIHEQYVVVPVTRGEVYDKSLAGQQTGLQKLPAGDVLSDIKRGLTGQGQIQSKQELKRKQFRELENRVDTVGSTLAKGQGNSYSVISSAKMLALLKEFWEGEKILEDEMDAMVSETDFSISSRNLGDTQ